ncbi:MAG: bacteriophage abortive infection AbiH family protein [Dysgonomonas sp.]
MELFIIGNGFDVYHGIESRYSHFADYVEEHNSDLYDCVSEFLGHPEDFWKDFETNLQHLDEDNLTDYARAYLMDYGADDWSDSGHHDYQYEIEQKIDLLTDEMTKMFIAWVNQIDISKASPDLRGILKENALYLTFNYTQTLERVYKIDKKKVFHIHGEVGDDSYIYGHDYIKPKEKEVDISSLSDEEREAYYDEKSSDDVRVTEGEQIINGYYQKNYKPVSDIIKSNKDYFDSLKDVTRIHILGFSMGDIDLPYIEEIYNTLEKPDDVKWVVSFYNKDEDKEHNFQLENVGVDVVANVTNEDMSYWKEKDTQTIIEFN